MTEKENVFSDAEIKDDEFNKLLIRNYSTRPNQKSAYGPGLNATQTKDIFDAAAIHIKEKHNKLIEGVEHVGAAEAERKATFEQNEAKRKTDFETAESERENLFNQSQSERDSQWNEELANRQEVFDDFFNSLDIITEPEETDPKVMSEETTKKYVKKYSEEYIPKVATRNLADLNFKSAYINDSGEFCLLDGASYASAEEYIEVTGGEAYTFSWLLHPTRSFLYLYQYDTDKSYISHSHIGRVDAPAPITLNVGVDCKYIRIRFYTPIVEDGNIWSDLVPDNFQIEKGETVTEYIAPYVIDTKIIDAESIVTEERVAPIVNNVSGEIVAPIAKGVIVDTLFVEPKNFFKNAELVEGYVSEAGTPIAYSGYNLFRVSNLQADITYGVYPHTRFVANATSKTNISSGHINGVTTFTLTEESTVEISFFVNKTDEMLLYNADLYSYEDVEKYYQNVLDTEKVVIPKETSTTHGNILLGKKWAVCGDSFSEVITTTTEDSYIVGGLYDGYKKSYGYIIGNRNDMDIQHLAAGGKTLAYPADGTFHNSFTDVSGSAPYNYTNIAEDVDYITLYFGINDSHHENGSSGTDGEDVTGYISLGTIDDADNTTFCGAWNVCLEWLIRNRPFAHIGIIVSNGCVRDEFRTATIAAAKKWGIPYIDLNGDERTPMMLRSTNPAFSSVAKEARLRAQSIEYGGNTHPNAKALEYESTFIETWLRTL